MPMLFILSTGSKAQFNPPPVFVLSYIYKMTKEEGKQIETIRKEIQQQSKGN